MRLGDGTDLLGVNDPRSDSIGIIRVDPTDVRQDVLTAILAQNELNRKQIVIVLHEQNKAFQRPVDFDGLKEMRRSLKAELVIVARSGSGSAEFARQRRFAVYSSLENFVSSLQTDAPAQDGRKGWFGGRKQKDSPATDALDLGRPVPLPLVRPVSGDAAPVAPAAQAQAGAGIKDDEEDIPTLTSPGADAIVAGGAVALGAAGAAFLAHDDDLLAPPPPVNPLYPALNGKQDEVRKPAGTPPSPRAAEPGIIQYGKSTKKLPAVAPDAAAASAAASASPILAAPAVEPKPIKSSNPGKQRRALAGTAVPAGAGMVAGGAAAFAAARPPTTTSSPPPGGGTPAAQGGGGGGGRGRRSRRLLAILLVLLTVLLLAGIALASPPGQQVITHILPGTTTATVTITPNNRDIADNFVITAVTGTPNAAARQVQASIISATSQQASASANATGSIPGKHATGPLQFTNLSSSNIVITVGSVIGADGVQVNFPTPLTVPLAGITVTGTAAVVGTAGNIAAFDINRYCCSGNNIFVKNLVSFTGGVNPQLNKLITQNDITSATNKLISAVKPQAQNQLGGKVKANQAVVPNTLSCKANINSIDHRVGDEAPTVTVKGTATCSEEVYDRDGALKLAAAALTTKATGEVGKGYAPADNRILTTVTQATVIDARQTVSVLVHAEGIWVFQLTSTFQNQLKNAIANKSKSDATTYLLATPGIIGVQIAISDNSNTLPAANSITIVVKTIHGPTGTPTSTPGGPTPTTAPGVSPTPSPTSQNGQGGS